MGGGRRLPRLPRPGVPRRRHRAPAGPRRRPPRPADRPRTGREPAVTPPAVQVALAAAVRTLPRGAGLAYEPKFDGHRMVVLRTEEDVVLQARSGRIVTGAFPDLAAAARQLPAGTVLDGEVVVWHGGRTDFALVQRR
ncbi:predicted protein, partial [Streptomyces sp. C]